MDSIPLNIELPSEFSKCELDITTLKALKGDQGLEDGEIIGRLEDTILKHFRAIAFYQGHINVRKRGINTILPREVLSEVFYVIARHDFTIASDNFEPPSLSWLELAHVCRYWRNIVLTSPRIFSLVYLPAGNQDRLQACLHYSRQAPLDVIYCDNLNQVDRQKWLYNQWLTLHPHLSHTRTLTLRTQLADTTETALVLPLSTTLTRLTLNDPFLRAPSQSEATKRAIDQMFGALPNLLQLTSDPYTLCQSDWTERAFPANLQTLIVDNPFGEEPTPSLPRLISALQKLPSLRQLEFWGLRSEDFSGSHTISPARIHPLESLHLDGHCDPCTSILSCIDSTHRLYARPALHICDNPLAMNIFLDSLTGLLERQCLSSEESYVLVNSTHSRLGGCTLKTRLKVRPMGNSLVIPCETVFEMLHNSRGSRGPGSFQY
ncbi:hypothetical protein QCA50_006718 [Cerrena zonata]|uniref:F-box domain-containing protein n=1 Tax=Cerrena zonata TaxID=2478898 RepID=A0AAW0GJL4_9APHY